MVGLEAARLIIEAEERRHALERDLRVRAPRLCDDPPILADQMQARGSSPGPRGPPRLVTGHAHGGVAEAVAKRTESQLEIERKGEVEASAPIGCGMDHRRFVSILRPGRGG